MGFELECPGESHRQGLVHQQTDDEFRGPIEIIRSSYKLLGDNAETSATILVTIVLPAAVTMLLNHCFFYAVAHKYLPYPKPPPDETKPDIQVLILIGVVLLVIGFAVTVNLVAAMFYFVSVASTGARITFKDVLRALPHWWKLVAVTGLWGEWFALVMAAVFVLSQILSMIFIDVSKIPLVILIILTFTESRAFLFLVVSIVEMAFGVTVFEKVDGLKSFARSWKLLRHRWYIALGIFTIIDVPKTLMGDALGLIQKSEIALAVKIVIASVLVALTSLLTLLGSVSYALFYKSCGSCIDDENVYRDIQFQVGCQLRADAFEIQDVSV
ncbi:hypothetical protein R1flu_000445 [Riccia fluitans]|uniref:Uncharacterized protein n=1 Tax=Riccia fluitans TaxID=41844 RepID=A0ABD1Y0Y2_9MARC